MLQLTTLQILKLSELVDTYGTYSYTVTQNFRGPEHSCDHILVEWETASCRFDPAGNIFDVQSKEKKS